MDPKNNCKLQNNEPLAKPALTAIRMGGSYKIAFHCFYSGTGEKAFVTFWNFRNPQRLRLHTFSEDCDKIGFTLM